MNKQRKGAVLAFVVALAFIGLEAAFGVQTGIAGAFVAGMAAGLLVGDQMARDPAPEASGTPGSLSRSS